METDAVVLRVSDGLQLILRRLAGLAAVVALFATLVGAATFATGLWIFDGDGRMVWTIIGGVLCLFPVGAALIARWQLGNTAKLAPRLLDDVRSFINVSSESARVLINHDTGQPVAAYSKSFSALRKELNEQRDELPALSAGVRAITGVPGLAALAVVGALCIGALGTVLLIGGLID